MRRLEWEEAEGVPTEEGREGERELEREIEKEGERVRGDERKRDTEGFRDNN